MAFNSLSCVVFCRRYLHRLWLDYMTLTSQQFHYVVLLLNVVNGSLVHIIDLIYGSDVMHDCTFCHRQPLEYVDAFYILSNEPDLF